MRAVVTRVTRAKVEVGADAVGEIGPGLLVLVGVAPDDTTADAASLAKKIYELRVFADAAGAMNRSLAETGGAILAVSQFTLYGDVRKGRRPSFARAAPAAHGRTCFDAFTAAARALGAEVRTGIFGADMMVTSVNDGPVTILIDTSKLF